MEVPTRPLNDQPDEHKSYFTNSEGLAIFCKYWYPQLSEPGELRAAVFVSHGVGEHCQVYSKLASKLNECNMLLFSHDHVGHGQSEGERVQISDFSTYCNDVIQHVNIIKNKHPNVPVFVIGHSVGAAIAVKIALDNIDMFAGMVFFAPAVIICPRWLSTSSAANFIAKGFSRLFPAFQVQPINPHHLSHDQDAVQKYTDDPLVWHGGVKAQWLVRFLGALTELRDRFSELTCPFFILQGTEDKVTDPAGAQMLYDNASSVNKRIKMFPGAYHQVHNEPNGQGDEAVSDLIKWITDIVSE